MYREELPNGCPPEDADQTQDEQVVYRLVTADPPVDDDFKSHFLLNPAKDYRGHECIASGLSVVPTVEDAQSLTSLPALRGKLPCKVTLSAEAGMIKQTRAAPHHTWWPFADFDILACCEMVT